VAAFGLDPEHELFALQRELASAEYRPGHRLFCIYEGKPRVIATAPFRDRVVHHAVMNLIEPPLGRAFIFDSYACRSGNGVQAGVTRMPWKPDVQQYFRPIDHDLLKEELQRCSDTSRDRATFKLLGLIIDGSPTTPTALRYFPGDDLSRRLEGPPASPSAT
jgi:RNA-directed DNA polymerase